MRTMRIAGELACLALTFLTIPVWGMSSRPPEAVPLWEALSPPSRLDSHASAQEPWVLQEQSIRFRPDILSLLQDVEHPLQHPFAIHLPGRPDLHVTITSRQAGLRGSTIVQGLVDGPVKGDVLLSIVEEAVAGTVRIGAESWRIEPKAQHRHRLVEVDVAKFPPD